MNVQILLNGLDITNYVVNYTTEKRICDGRGMLNFEISNNYNIASILTYDTVVLYENGNKRGTYHVATKNRVVEKYSTIIGCQDGSKKLDDYFIDNSYKLNYPTTIRYWIEKFLTDAHISYNITTTENGGILSENSSIGLDSLYSVLQGLLQQAGWYVYMDENDVAQIGTLEIDSETVADSIDETEILEYESNSNDDMLRNRVVVWGNANPLTNSQVFIDTSKHTPWDYDYNDKRTVVVANETITNTSQGYTLANKILRETTKITFTKKITVPGARNIKIGNIIYLSCRDFEGIGLVTSISTEVSKAGELTHITLDERCPKLFGFYGYTGGYVYIGTKGSGVWRKPLKFNHTWSNFSTGITNLNIIDLAISNGVFACVAEDGYLYTRDITRSYWSKVPTPPLTHIVTNEPISGAICTSCSIDKITNQIYATYTAYSGLFHKYYYPTVSGELLGSWLVSMSPTGGGRSILPMLLDNVTLQNYPNPGGNPLPSGEFRIAAINIDNNGSTQFISSINYIGASGVIPYPNESLGMGGFSSGQTSDSGDVLDFTTSIPVANSGYYLVTHTELWNDYVNSEYSKIYNYITVGSYPTGWANTPTALKTSKYVPTVEDRMSLFYVNPSSDVKINKTTQYYDVLTSSWKVKTTIYDFTSIVASGTVCLYLHLENDTLYIVWVNNAGGEFIVHSFNTISGAVISTTTHSFPANTWAGDASFSYGRIFYILSAGASQTVPNPTQNSMMAMNVVTGDYYYGTGVIISNSNATLPRFSRDIVGFDEYGLFWSYARILSDGTDWRWQMVTRKLTTLGVSTESIFDLHVEAKSNVAETTLDDLKNYSFIAPAQGYYLIGTYCYYLFRYPNSGGHRTFAGGNISFHLASNNHTRYYSYLLDIFGGSSTKWMQEGHQVPLGPWVWDHNEDILVDYGIEYINSANNPTFSRSFPTITTMTAKSIGAFGIGWFTDGLRIIDADTCILQGTMDIPGITSSNHSVCHQVDDVDNSIYVNLQSGTDTMYGMNRFGATNKIIKLKSEDGLYSMDMYPARFVFGNTILSRYYGNRIRLVSFYPNDDPAYTSSNRHTYRINERIGDVFIQNNTKFNQPMDIESSSVYPVTTLGYPVISGEIIRTGYPEGENDSGLYISPFGVNATFSRVESNLVGATIPDARIMDIIGSGTLKSYIIFPETTSSGTGIYYLDSEEITETADTIYTHGDLLSKIESRYSLSGNANHIETTNFNDYPYIFVGMRGSSPSFYQKDGYNKGEPGTAFVLRNTNLPDSQITVIRTDDII